MMPNWWGRVPVRVLLLVALLPAVTFELQAQNEAEVEAARAAADTWLELVDEGDYGASWEAAAAGFRAAVTKEQWAQSVTSARGAFEPFGPREMIQEEYTTALPNAPPGEYVVMQFETEVAGDRKVIETVVPMKDPDGEWRVSGYFVRPM